MNWYAAHIVMQVELKNQSQTTFPVWENIYLVEAPSAEDALSKAKTIGIEHEGDSSGTFCWEDQPAKWVFKGVRKLILLTNPGSTSNKPQDGSEVTFTTIEFQSKDDLEKFFDGEESNGKFLD